MTLPNSPYLDTPTRTEAEARTERALMDGMNRAMDALFGPIETEWCQFCRSERRVACRSAHEARGCAGG